MTHLAGGILLFGLFVVGVWTLLTKSLSIGLSMIGGTSVGGRVLNIVSGQFAVAGSTIIENETQAGIQRNTDQI
ncbi:hypothetical protein [Maricaulis sp.]|uniref:hypothetical protein n=1 Tax=Maricaulis sp. TaxID=1486257 RepID=UPI002629A013|nr:hypothetical protein [Maricaulis sp.]